MTSKTRTVCLTFALIGFAAAVSAQTPPPAPQAPQAPTGASAGPAVASPTYTSIPLEIAVNRPAAWQFLHVRLDEAALDGLVFH